MVCDDGWVIKDGWSFLMVDGSWWWIGYSYLAMLRHTRRIRIHYGDSKIVRNVGINDNCATAINFEVPWNGFMHCALESDDAAKILCINLELFEERESTV